MCIETIIIIIIIILKREMERETRHTPSNISLPGPRAHFDDPPPNSTQFGDAVATHDSIEK